MLFECEQFAGNTPDDNISPGKGSGVCVWGGGGDWNPINVLSIKKNIAHLYSLTCHLLSYIKSYVMNHHHPRSSV